MVKAAYLELERHDWSKFRCGCGQTAGHLPETFRRLIEASDPEEAVGFRLDGHVEVQSMLFEASVPAVPVILAALAGGVARFAKSHLLVTLLQLVSGESHSSEVAAGRDDLSEQCCLLAKDGLWVLYQEAVAGDTENALDVLDFLEEDSARLRYFRSTLKSRLSKR
ncbi:hypothetical protein [Streptomyces sp. NPDC004270]